MPTPKGTPEEVKTIEKDLTEKFNDIDKDTKRDLIARVAGVPAKAGATGMQFVGYTTLEQFYRGDQWLFNEPPGASQRTDNYCAVVVDVLSSLVFDDQPEISCPPDDPTDDLDVAAAEAREKLIQRVYEDNESKTELDELAKVGSLYGDAFIIGPWVEKRDEKDRVVAPDASGKWKICFSHCENPAEIRVHFTDMNFKHIDAYIWDHEFSLTEAKRLYGDKAKERGIVLEKSIRGLTQLGIARDSYIPMCKITQVWDDTYKSVFINGQLLDWWKHDWGFVPIEFVKNIHSPNHPYGKSDIEDIMDPQMLHNRVSNDLANLLRWFSTVNMWGKNIEGMQALVAGLSKIYSLPEDGELHTFEKPGDPYIVNTFAQQRKGAITEISGMSDSFLSSSQVSASSGRALAVAFQGVLRKLNPKMKRYALALQNLNKKILRLYEIYFPETEAIIQKKYRNEVYIAATMFRNITDTLNKFQGGLISHETAMKEAGVKLPNEERKLMRKDLQDPVLGPQVARQPQLLPQLSEGQNQPGDQPAPGPGNLQSSPEGMAASMNQHASGAAPVPMKK